MSTPSDDKDINLTGETPSLRKRSRALPDLSALYAEEQTSAPPPTEEAKPARTRKTLELSLLDDIEVKPAQMLSSGKGVNIQSNQALLPDASATIKSPIPDLTSLSREDKPGTTSGLTLQPELQQYLSPDLWRKLNSPNPTRGVLINALERVRSILYQLSTFIPHNLVQEKMRRSVPGLTSGQLLRGTLLFSDVSGFTALSERLAVLGQEGAEELTRIMNQYFTRMLEILEKSGGILLKFAGDATMVYFPQQKNNRQAVWAVRAGQRMLRAMSEFSKLKTPSETVTLRMKIGLATGDFLAASVGSAKRMEYAILGGAVTQTMAAEGASTGGGQLIADKATVDYLEPGFSYHELKSDFYILEQAETEILDDFEIKAETRRARGAIPWSASPQAILAQIEVALRQIQSIVPYLAPELVEQVLVYAHKRTISSQYRLTTVLFINFIGFETLLSTWGPEGVSKITSLLGAYFNAMQEVIARYGGIVSRIDPYSKGTKMLVLFGAPVAHEDDPQRAVSAALAMNIELEALNETWHRKYARYLPKDFSGPLIQHRIGITYGDTFAGQVGSVTRREYTVMGDDVNLAARLMGAANMGQILVSQRIYDSVIDYFVLMTLPSIKVKGKSKPISLFQVEGPRDDTIINRMHRRGPLLGREAELTICNQVLEKVLEGKGEVFTIQGLAGIGKSHLADEILKRSIARGSEVWMTQCRSYAAETPYASWSALLRTMAGITPNDYLPHIHLAKLRTLVSSLQLNDELVRPLATIMGLELREQNTASQRNANTLTPVSLDQESSSLADMVRSGKTRRRGSQLDIFEQLEEQQTSETGQVWHSVSVDLLPHERENIHESISRLLKAMSVQKPLVIFFEDAQWMDPASRALVNYLGVRLRANSVLILMAIRGAQEPGTIPGQVVSLGPLTLDGTTALVSHLLIKELAQVIHQQSNGNPSFVDEITRWFQRTRNINASELKQALQASDFLQKLVLSGIETMPESQHEIARVASVLGNEFRSGEIQALLSSSIDSVTLSNHLRGLVQAHILTLAEAGADALYAFQQSFVRDILYNSLPYEQRRAYHRKVAEYLSLPLDQRRSIQNRIAAALESRQKKSPALDAEKIAYHFEQADEWFNAARYLHQAGSWAYQEQVYAKAIRDYNRGLVDLAKHPVTTDQNEVNTLKVKLLTGQGDVALITSEYLTAVTCYEQAIATLPVDASTDISIDLTYRLALVLPTQKRAEEAETRLSKVLGTTKGGVNAGLNTLLVWLLWRSGKPGINEWMDNCTRLIDSQNDPRSGWLRVLIDDFKEGWQVAREGYLALREPLGAALLAVQEGDQALLKKDYPQALEFYSQVHDIYLGDKRDFYMIALAFYRQAEVYRCLRAEDACRSALNKASDCLENIPPAFKAEGQMAIHQAIKSINSSKPKRWPSWNYQPYDDAFRIAFLFRIWVKPLNLGA